MIPIILLDLKAFISGECDAIDSRHAWVELNQSSHQSGHGGDHATDNSVSCLNHSGGGGIDFRDKLAAVNGNLSKIHAACRDKLSPLKTEPIVRCTIRNLISCECLL